jgi:hypothetical protein
MAVRGRRKRHYKDADGNLLDKHAPAPGTTRTIPKIKCQECGKEMLRITQNHLTRSHDGMLYDDYLKKWGPNSTSLEVYNKDRGGTTARALVSNPDIRNEIYSLAMKGYHHKTIAATIGISPSTLELWLTKGKPDNVTPEGQRLEPDVYYEFVEEYRKHEALAETEAVDSLIRASKGDWKAALAFLERRFPDHWRSESKRIVDIEGSVEHVMVRDLEVQALLEDPDTAAMACELLERLSQGDRAAPIEAEAEVEEAEFEEL